MKQAAVIGNPISHSKSPLIFKLIAESLGQNDFKYDALQVNSDELEICLKKIQGTPGFVGINVTRPYKESVLPLIHEVSAEASAVGSVNVVHFKNGKLFGFNTDVFGIQKTLQDQNCKLKNSRILIFGAGGAARAVAYAVGTEQASEVILYNRSLDRATRLASDMHKQFPGTHFRAIKQLSDTSELAIKLLVNTTPVGMKGIENSDYFSDMKSLRFEKDALAFDLIYEPALTPFLIQAKEQGIRIIGGLDMLIYQALQTWTIWFGEVDFTIKNEIAKHLQKPNLIYLTGFMGAGKTQVGSVLATQLGWKFLDTDQMIEKKSDQSITEIFRDHGEPYFRQLEKDAVLGIESNHPTVVALGGGALIDSAVQRHIQKTGTLIYLSAEPETLSNRLQSMAATRPLLSGIYANKPSELKAKIVQMLTQRKPAYQTADFQIATDSRSAQEIVEMIMAKVLKKDSKS